MTDELIRVRALRTGDDPTAYLAAAMLLAQRAPYDVAAQMEAAYACDRHGEEHDAIRYYDAAWQLGVPDGERRHFIVGYGSTLRNVGRAEEAIALLTEASTIDPAYVAYRPFLALALLDGGHPRAAVAAMLGVVLDLAPDGALDGFQRALGHYFEALLDPGPVAPPR